MEAPAGFRREKTIQRQFRDAISSCNTSSPSPDFLLDSEVDSDDIISTQENCLAFEDTNPSHQPSSSLTVPILQSVDKQFSFLPSQIAFTEDIIHTIVGFRRIDTLKCRLQHLYQDTVQLNSLPTDEILDVGDLDTLKKTLRNTPPVHRPSGFGEVFHIVQIFRLVAFIMVYSSLIDIAEWHTSILYTISLLILGNKNGIIFHPS